MLDQMDEMILTADVTRIQMSVIEDVRVINIHALSNALKPLTQAGEKIKIKIQPLQEGGLQNVGQ